MKTFEVAITKSYIIKMKAVDISSAKRCAEFFTGDIKDISTDDDRQKYKFQIDDIECTVNESFQ